MSRIPAQQSCRMPVVIAHLSQVFMVLILVLLTHASEASEVPCTATLRENGSVKPFHKLSHNRYVVVTHQGYNSHMCLVDAQGNQVAMRFGPGAGDLNPHDPEEVIATWNSGQAGHGNYCNEIASMEKSTCQQVSPAVPQFCDVFITNTYWGHQLEDRDDTVGLHVHSSTYQKWQFTPAPDNKFFISSYRGLQLEDRDGTLGLHAHKKTYQMWTVTRVPKLGQAQWFLTSHRGKQLEDRAGTIGLHDDKSANQMWSITEVDHEACQNAGPIIQVRPAVPQFCDIFIMNKYWGHQLEDRDGTVGLQAHSSTHQRWQFTPAPDNKFFITSHRGMQLEDRDGTLGLHAHKSSYQMWKVTEVPNDGQVHWLLTSHRGLQLEDRNGTLGLHHHKGAYQLWSIIEVDHEACQKSP